MGLIQAIASAPGLRNLAVTAFSGPREYGGAVEPDFALPWDGTVESVAETDVAAIYLVCSQSGVTSEGEPVFSRAFASDDEGLALSEDGYLINSAGHFLLGIPLGLRVEQTRSIGLPALQGIATLAVFFLLRNTSRTLSAEGILPAAALPWTLVAVFTAWGT